MPEILNNIILPFDFSERSMHTLERSFSIAEGIDGTIILHYIMTGNSENRDELREKLEKVAKESSEKTGINIKAVVTKGKPYKEIVKLASRENSKYIVIGTSSRFLDAEYGLGENTAKVLKKTKCDVIALNIGVARNSIKNIVLPVDLTEATNQKVYNAIEIAKRYDSVINVVSILLTDDDEEIYNLELQMKLIKKTIEKENIICATKFIEAVKGKHNLAEVIINHSTEVNGDLIIIMIQQERGFVKRFVTSTSNEIICKSHVPVICVVPKKKYEYKKLSSQ